MKKLATILTAFCVCTLFMGASAPYAVMLSTDAGSSDGGNGAGGASFAIGIALLMLITIRGWRIGVRARKKYAESERKAYSYKPRAERFEKTDRPGVIMKRAALEDMDFPSGFGGIHNMQQLERNRALYKLYSETTDDEGGWDDARR